MTCFYGCLSFCNVFNVIAKCAPRRFDIPMFIVKMFGFLYIICNTRVYITRCCSHIADTLLFIILTNINPCFAILKYNNSKIDVDNSYYCCLTARIALDRIRPTNISAHAQTHRFDSETFFCSCVRANIACHRLAARLLTESKARSNGS